MASLIYKKLFLYRAAMNLLYTGSYYKRARRLCRFIDGKSVLELCFADTLIAGWCRKHEVLWTGYDINNYFVTCAIKKGYKAYPVNVEHTDALPLADICLMSGSLYHFFTEDEKTIMKMLQAAPKVILCEPVRNLSSGKGLTGRLARFFSTTPAGEAPHRYTRESLLRIIGNLSNSEGFSYKIADEFKKDITLILTR